MAKSDKSKLGKRTILNPALIDQIIKMMVDNGVSAANAAQSVGVKRTTFYEWRERGRGDARGIYRELEDELQKAEIKPVIIAENVVYKKMFSPDERIALKAATFILQNKDKENYGAQKTIKAEVTNSPQITMFLPENDRDNL